MRYDLVVISFSTACQGDPAIKALAQPTDRKEGKMIGLLVVIILIIVIIKLL
jgi:hypothetical protein